MIFPIVPTASGILNMTSSILYSQCICPYRNRNSRDKKKENIQAVFVQFLVIADGKLKVMGENSGLLVVTGSVACKLEDLSSEVFHDHSQDRLDETQNAIKIMN